jgi:hypothetical protein
VIPALDRLRDALVRASQIGKLKLDVSFLRRERDGLLLALGEAVVGVIERGEMQEPQQLSTLLDQIRRIDERRSHGLDELEAIKAGG